MCQTKICRALYKSSDLDGELKKYEVSTIVRACEATYDTTLVEKGGICVLDWPFDHSALLHTQIVEWLSLMKNLVVA